MADMKTTHLFLNSIVSKLLQLCSLELVANILDCATHDKDALHST